MLWYGCSNFGPLVIKQTSRHARRSLWHKTLEALVLLAKSLKPQPYLRHIAEQGFRLISLEGLEGARDG